MELSLELNLLFQTAHSDHQYEKYSENRNTTPFPMSIDCYTNDKNQTKYCLNLCGSTDFHRAWILSITFRKFVFSALENPAIECS